MSEPGPLLRPRPFWHRNLDPEERRRVMNDLALISQPHWTWRFVVMLTLSVIVAVMGLLAGSAAVVIGAMLLAPLMTPVLGMAAALAMGLPRKTFKSTMRVILASLWCVALAYIASKVALTSAQALSAEIEARTRPDLRDLLVALAAGAAGAYATVRSDTSSSLPGVAVAVALVPPLATIGITLEAGNFVWARGATLLYVTNLVAIVLAGLLVFLVTGFVPPRRFATTVPRILAGLAVAAVAVVAISVPLLRASQGAAEDSLRDRDGRRAVESWLAGTPLVIESLDFSGNPVVIEISGPTDPPPRETLEELLAPALGPNVQAAIFIDETRQPTTTSTTVVSNEEVRQAEIEIVLNEWLGANDDGNSYELNAFELSGTRLQITVSGLGVAPPIRDLIARLAVWNPNEIVVPNLRWSQLEAVPLGDVPPTPTEVSTDQLRIVVQRWANTFELDVTDLEFNGVILRVEVVGPQPGVLEALLESVEESEVRVETVEVFYTQRIRLETTTTTVPTTAATTEAQTSTTTEAGG